MQRTYWTGGRECWLCPAGHYQKSCTECAVCPPGSFTTDWNREDSCHRCYRDCSADFQLVVVQNCSRTADLRCSCAPGFRCTETSPLTDNCRVCEKIQDSTTTAVKSTRDQQTSSSASSSPSNTSSPSSTSSTSGTSSTRCSPPRCGAQSVPAADSSTQVSDHSRVLAAILCPVVVMSCVAVAILFCVRRPGDETCFRQTIAKLCSKEGQNASHKSKDSTRPFSRDSFGAKQPNSSVAANLGPVHVHNAGTVVFSLLSQFTGHVGPTVEAGEAERSSPEPDGGRPVFQPSSPHISEEEQSGDSIFFPSQEQGKDFHMSKEEAL
ncbi:tumor necrosis factor receptor superfamily member 5 isoform X2 [Stegastes partitus]|uniref:Tumor necrosis factor receptor superfamily member 5 isoform X2 n=1 Tax=Stegastes partitus TaxID=144197 RepID=A0A9Y4KCP2_9TELE|nr:PREDICTED: tumor necrosis factor receptor superfamily member 5-like isoform X2 [Stegastes partitus]